MEKPESVEDFYERRSVVNDKKTLLNNAGLGHFNVFTREACALISQYRRRDFYKIIFIVGTGRVYYANEWIKIDKPALLFPNPLVPYAWEAESPEQKGWFCLFTEDFIQHDEKINTLQDSPLFKIGASPVYFLSKSQQKEIDSIFRKMQQEMLSDYQHKFSIVRNYLHLIVHESMRQNNTTDSINKYINAGTRITHMFLELLERQFPIDIPDIILRLRTPQDFAHCLSVHVNHLNRSVKQATGKTTSQHITERIVKEAKALLLHSDNQITEIAHGLGFEYAAHFTSFYKKNTGYNPAAVRKEMV